MAREGEIIMKKTMAFITALVITALSVPVSMANAEGYAQGDVDMDGMITGRDAAIVSQYDDGILKLELTEEQLLLADMNGDGIVDSADAALIFEQQEYELCDINMDGCTDMSDATKILRMYFCKMIDPDLDFGLQYLLSDIDCDGDVDTYDMHSAGEGFARIGANIEHFEEEGKYYIIITDEDEQQILADDLGIMFGFYEATTLEELYKVKNEWCGWFDVNSDEEVSVSDATSVLGIYASNATDVELDEIQTNALGLADIDANGTVDISDATLVLTAYAKTGAGLL